MKRLGIAVLVVLLAVVLFGAPTAAQFTMPRVVVAIVVAAGNLSLTGNTISSTNTNGDITLDPNGTGDVVVASGADLDTARIAHNGSIDITDLGSGNTATVAFDFVQIGNNGSNTQLGGNSTSATSYNGSLTAGNNTSSNFGLPVRTPASAAAACTHPTVVVDASFIYVCTANNTWKRAALSTW